MDGGHASLILLPTYPMVLCGWGGPSSDERRLAGGKHSCQ